jgi:hypothetical protein
MAAITHATASEHPPILRAGQGARTGLGGRRPQPRHPGDCRPSRAGLGGHDTPDAPAWVAATPAALARERRRVWEPSGTTHEAPAPRQRLASLRHQPLGERRVRRAVTCHVVPHVLLELVAVAVARGTDSRVQLVGVEVQGVAERERCGPSAIVSSSSGVTFGDSVSRFILPELEVSLLMIVSAWPRRGCGGRWQGSG